ncbi:hypothetical protein B0H14DRAFT_3678845 [Mycena olivaceomarginata]|nr:hypothetical protein B0H14DRAFT_3678845 [Mycena olivaceomarginata]
MGDGAWVEPVDERGRGEGQDTLNTCRAMSRSWGGAPRRARHGQGLHFLISSAVKIDPHPHRLECGGSAGSKSPGTNAQERGANLRERARRTGSMSICMSSAVRGTAHVKQRRTKIGCWERRTRNLERTSKRGSSREAWQEKSKIQDEPKNVGSRGLTASGNVSTRLTGRISINEMKECICRVNVPWALRTSTLRSEGGVGARPPRTSRTSSSVRCAAPPSLHLSYIHPYFYHAFPSSSISSLEHVLPPKPKPSMDITGGGGGTRLTLSSFAQPPETWGPRDPRRSGRICTRGRAHLEVKGRVVVRREVQSGMRAVRDRRTGAQLTMAEARVHECVHEHEEHLQHAHHPFDLPCHRMFDTQDKATHTNTMCACGRPQCGSSTSEINSGKQRGKCTAALSGGQERHGHVHRLHLLAAETIRGLPTKDDRSTRRARPPSPVRRCRTRRINERGEWIPDNGVHIRMQSRSRRRGSARETGKNKPRGGARETKPAKNKPLGEKKTQIQDELKNRPRPWRRERRAVHLVRIVHVTPEYNGSNEIWPMSTPPSDPTGV